MKLYNIRKSKFTDFLSASGVENRWNREEEYVIYTGESIALATLEMVVHRSGINTFQDYKLMILEAALENENEITTIKPEDFPENWKSIEAYPELQKLGSEWYQSKSSLLLKVPSAIIPREYNYLINTRHPDFEKKVSIIEKVDFDWDKRLL